jgi:4-amino-4-deoxy-L-arabinose transferase-like glycosyltransferase
MSRKKPKPLTQSVPEVEKPSQGFWQFTALPFLEKRSLPLAFCLIALATFRIVATWSETGLTWDEPGHMACGLQYLAQHVYRYEAQHPPLARVMSALGPFLDGSRPLGGKGQDQEGVNVIYSSGHPGRTLALMRFGILPFFALAGFMVYFWARRHFGNVVAVLAAGLFSLVPPVLAHAGLATTDMPLTGCLAAAFFCLLLWAEQPSWKHSLLLGFTTALAVVSKFTALGFFPAAAVLALLAYLVVERPGVDGLATAAKQRAVPFCLAVVTGAMVIWAVYSFSFGKVSGWNVSLPAPELFEGVKFAIYHNGKGHAAYLLGEIRNTGWWYFFPVVLAVKTPIAYLLLLVYGVSVSWARRARVVYLLPLAFALGILLPSMTSHVNIGLRHILPIYVGFSILAAVGLASLMQRAQAANWAGFAAAALVGWLAVSGAVRHPDYLAYFNELGGDHPERILVDSDLDWGQDTVRLARRLKELGATQVSFSTLNLTPDRLVVWPGFPPVKYIFPLQPVEGWTAVSPTMLAVRQYGMEHRYPNLRPWFTYLQPVEKVGSLWLYYVPPGSLPADLQQPPAR